MRSILFGFYYRTNDGREWHDTMSASTWEDALERITSVGGFKISAICSVIDEETGNIDAMYDDAPNCPKHLQDHPAFL